MNDPDVIRLLESIDKKMTSLEHRMTSLEVIIDERAAMPPKEWLTIRDAVIFFNRPSDVLYRLFRCDDRHWIDQQKHPLYRGAFWRRSAGSRMEVNIWLFDIWLASDGDPITCDRAMRAWIKSREKPPKR